jgi:DNA-binding transcriptional LysR family regulator
MRTPLSLEALEVLDAIERKGSFAAAARVLHKVPSAISYTVQKLEQDLGVTLFQKQGRRAVLTSAGEVLVEQGRQLLLAADELAATTRQVATGWEPRLRITVDTVVSIDALLPVIAGLYKEQPVIEIKLMTEALGGTWEALVENRADLVVGGIGGVPGHQGIRCEPWWQREHIFVAAPGHPICQESQPISTAVIKRYRSVIVSDTSRNATPLSRGILNQQAPLTVPDMTAKIEAHRCGLGVGYVPANRVTQYLAIGELIQLDIEEIREDEPCVLAWKSSNQGQALHWVLDRLREFGI